MNLSEPEIYEKLAKQSRRAALLSLAGVLIVLAVLLYTGFKLSALQRQVLDTEALLKQRRTELGDIQKQLDQKRAELSVKDLALSVVRAKSSGPRPRVTFYRSSVADQINEALGQLGFDVRQSEYPGNPALRDKPADTLEYGCAVTAEDIQTIALALTNKGGLAIRRIAPAHHLKDPLLVQLIATMSTDSRQPALSPDQIRRWTRKTQPCKAEETTDPRVANSD
jgi:hypothetical protein